MFCMRESVSRRRRSCRLPAQLSTVSIFKEAADSMASSKSEASCDARPVSARDLELKHWLAVLERRRTKRGGARRGEKPALAEENKV